MSLRGSIALLALLAAGCGDVDGPPCPTNSIIDGVANCQAARYFAARDSRTLVPSQEEVDRYFDRWSRLVEAEPILAGRQPQRHRDYVVVPEVHTTNPRVIEAWTHAVPEGSTGDVRVSLHTGDDDFDAIIDQLRPIGMNAFWSNESGTYLFSLWVGAAYSEELLAADLAPYDSWFPPPMVQPQDEGTFQWLASDGAPTGTDDATAYIEFTFGWGDCLAGCFGFHSLRAYVPADAPPTVYDLGGDPLPPGMMLSPSTIPLP